MALQGPTPIAVAMVLTLAAGLSIAKEHALPTVQGGSDRALHGKAAESKAPPQGPGNAARASPTHAVATGSQPRPSMGSRALTGGEAEGPNDLPARILPDHTPE